METSTETRETKNIINDLISETDIKEAQAYKQAKQERQAKQEKYASVAESTQTFSGIGMFKVENGDVKLCGRHGERDHIYPIEKAIKRYDETALMILSLAKRGVSGWDVLMDINNDFKAKILEAIKQRRAMNIEVEFPEEVLKFEQLQEAKANYRKDSMDDLRNTANK